MTKFKRLKNLSILLSCDSLCAKWRTRNPIKIRVPYRNCYSVNKKERFLVSSSCLIRASNKMLCLVLLSNNWNSWMSYLKRIWQFDRNSRTCWSKQSIVKGHFSSPFPYFWKSSNLISSRYSRKLLNNHQYMNRKLNKLKNCFQKWGWGNLNK
jgi:hypothetical protein